MASASTSKRLKPDVMNGMFPLKSNPCFLENLQFTNILDYCDTLDDIHKVNNNYRHALKKGEGLYTSQFVCAIHFLEQQEDSQQPRHYHFKSRVKAEMKKRESYTVQCWITFDNKVLSCECECAGGVKPACCKHAFALLYGLLDYSKNKLYSAPTERLQTWHKPKPFVVSPRKIKTFFQTTSKHTSLEVSPVNFAALDSLPLVTPIFSVCSANDNALDISLSYQKSIPLPKIDTVVKKFETFTFVSADDAMFFMEKIDLQLDAAQTIEKNTRFQSSTPLWFEERKKRITASNIFKIFNKMNESLSTNKPSEGSSMTDFVDKLLSPDDISNIAPVKLGKLREPSIQFKLRHIYNHSNFRDTGLCIHPEYTFIAGSPDGLFVDKTGDAMIVEIKTVFNFKKKSLADLISERKHFCIEEEDGMFHINKKHSYYFQIQCQMFCSGVFKCLFVVLFSDKHDLYQECILFDEEFWNSIFPCLTNFFFKFYLPKLREILA